MSGNVWRKCSSCKSEILHGGVYQRCSVSTCHKLSFCSVDCWDQHLPIMNHKSAWAEEENVPSKQSEGVKTMSKTIMLNSDNCSPAGLSKTEQEVLIVASKLKNYIKSKHGLNTSADVMEKLSQIVRNVTDEACNQAKSQGRKTLMDRDFI